MTVALLRDDLAASGLVERRRHGRLGLHTRRRARPDCVLLIAGPIDQALGEAWTRRALDGSPRSWRGFLKTWSARGALPPSADLGLAIQYWSQRVGPAQVHVVVTAHDDDVTRVHRQVEELLGVPVVTRAPLSGDGVLTPVHLVPAQLSQRLVLPQVEGSRTSAPSSITG